MGSASVSSQNPTLVSTHNALQIAGFILCVLVLSTAVLSKNVRRSATWFLFISLWMVWCVVYFLLVGQQLGGLPSREVCAIQGVMINAISAANCWSILSLSLEVFLLLYAAFRQRRYKYMN
ncbi:hypothetical protein DL96DRAFT_811258 [Flagelloscypha sp. PMI_526]|nr:hypothetical protein DL96DRAFT_811258 [Flagelloscypha sp. PMI_526]